MSDESQIKQLENDIVRFLKGRDFEVFLNGSFQELDGPIPILDIHAHDRKSVEINIINLHFTGTNAPLAVHATIFSEGADDTREAFKQLLETKWDGHQIDNQGMSLGDGPAAKDEAED